MHPRTWLVVSAARTHIQHAINQNSQILSLIESLNDAKRQIESQGSKVKELEDMLKQERQAREAAEDKYTKDGTTDLRGNPAVKKDTGNWRACPYILGISYF